MTTGYPGFAVAYPRGGGGGFTPALSVKSLVFVR
jgi:hypothetical protein